MSQLRFKRRVAVVHPPDCSLREPDEGHAYMRKLLALRQSGELPAAGMVELRIQHAASCGIFSVGLCNCDPAIIRHPPRD